jgi:hypothetical protein
MSEDAAKAKKIEAVCRQLCRENGVEPDRIVMLIDPYYEPMKINGSRAFAPEFVHQMPSWKAYERTVRDVLYFAQKVPL